MFNKKDIAVVCWLKNNTEWYYPTNKTKLDLSLYDHVQQLTIGDYHGDLYAAWMGHTEIERLRTTMIYRTK